MRKTPSLISINNHLTYNSFLERDRIGEDKELEGKVIKKSSTSLCNKDNL